MPMASPMAQDLRSSSVAATPHAMKDDYFRPLAQIGPCRPPDAVQLAGGWAWFNMAEHLSRSGTQGFVPASELPSGILERLTAPRAPVAGLSMDAPRVMAILNVTPDSFSDGGLFDTPAAALEKARALVAEGADILDIGGESTRPGAEPVSAEAEHGRTVPLIEKLAPEIGIPISIDTRNALTAGAALKAGAAMLNDVSAMTHDSQMAQLASSAKVPICLMHARGDPRTMQDSPQYDHALLDIYDYLDARIEAAEAAGIKRACVIVDPGIGFGKTVEHNLALIRGLGLLHGLGCPILLGASRKRFIGAIGGESSAKSRAPGSLAVALAGIAQGVQIIRVHDMSETRQALRLWRAVWKESDKRNE